MIDAIWFAIALLAGIAWEVSVINKKLDRIADILGKKL